MSRPRHQRDAPASAWIAGTALLFVFACALPTAQKIAAPHQAPMLELGVTRTAALACTRERCRDWYQLAIHGDRRISIEVIADADPLAADFGISLYSADLELVTQDREPYRRPRQLSAELGRGLYYLRVENRIDLGEPLHYRVRAIAGPVSRFDASSATGLEARATAAVPGRRAASPGPPARAIRPARKAPGRSLSRPGDGGSSGAPAGTHALPGTLVRCDVIEVERKAGLPIAVLIEAGAPTGVAPGQLGRLLEAGREIGRIEIRDVYPAGSRAEIRGELSGEIGVDTIAEIFDSTR